MKSHQFKMKAAITEAIWRDTPVPDFCFVSERPAITPNTPASKHHFFKVICAWQHFAGKPMKATSAAEAIDQDDLNAAERVLRAVIKWSRQQDATEWHTLHTMADKIEAELDR